jgi:hypothetical protein
MSYARDTTDYTVGDWIQIRTSGRTADRIFLTAQRDGLDFNLAYIPSHFNAPDKEEFATEYMRALFALGNDMAAGGYPWETVPPDYASRSR